MNKNELKAKLFEKLGDGKMDGVIAELSKAYDKSSEEYKELTLLIFQLSDLERCSRKGILKKRSKKEELNQINIGLQKLVRNINTENVQRYVFESNYGKYDENSADTKGKKRNEVMHKSVSYLKHAVILFLLPLAFFTDGKGMVKEHFPISNCDTRIKLIIEEVQSDIVEAEFLDALKKLEENISTKSNFYEEVILLKVRSKLNNENFINKRIISHSEFEAEEKAVTTSILQILPELQCDDLS